MSSRSGLLRTLEQHCAALRAVVSHCIREVKRGQGQADDPQPLTLLDSAPNREAILIPSAALETKTGAGERAPHRKSL